MSHTSPSPPLLSPPPYTSPSPPPNLPSPPWDNNNQLGFPAFNASGTVVGIAIGSLIVGIFLCFYIRRSLSRARAGQEAAAGLQLHAVHAPGLAVRQAHHEQARGVPSSVFAKFPVRQYASTAPAANTGLDRSTRSMVMKAASAVLVEPPHHTPESPGRPTPGRGHMLEPLARSGSSAVAGGPSTRAASISKALLRLRHSMSNSFRNPRQSISEDPAPAAAASASVRAEAGPAGASAPPLASMYDVEAPSPRPAAGRAELSQQALAAAQQAGIAAAGGLGVKGPPLKVNSVTGANMRGPSTLRRPSARSGVLEVSVCDIHVEDAGLQCAICLLDFEAGEMLRQLPCRHEFHQDCIDSWMVRHRTCPLCRHVLYEEESMAA